VREGILLFASKARYGPIPLRLAYLGRSAGSVLRSLRRLWGVRAFALCARGSCCSPPRLATDRSRSAWRIWGYLGGAGGMGTGVSFG
jgi:hypothetical protein